MKAEQREKLRLFGKIMFISYIAFLIYFLLVSDWYGRQTDIHQLSYNLVLFKEIKRFWIYRRELGSFVVFTNLVGNVLIFMPFGFFLPMASRFRNMFTTVICGFGLSLMVETVQLLARVGSFDVDDLFLNTVGGLLGYLFFVMCNWMRRRHAAKRKR